MAERHHRAGDNVTITDNSGEANLFVGADSGTVGGIGGSGNGYVTMTGGSLNSGTTVSSYGIQEVLGLTAGNSGIFTQSGGTNMSMVHAGDNQRYYTALSLRFVPGAYGQYNLQGGNLDPAAIFVGGNTSQGSSVPNAGTGVFVQTGGSVGITGVTGTKAVGLAVGGNWMPRTLTIPRPLTLRPSGRIPSATRTARAPPVLVGGVEGIGVSGTGTFTQYSGTNYIIGGGTGSGILNNSGISLIAPSALVLGRYNGSYTSSRGHYYYQGYGVGTYNLNGGVLTGNDPSGGTSGGLEVVGV